MRKLIFFLLSPLVFSFLNACGGGGDVPGSTGSPSSLRAGYNQVQKGMNPDQVLAVMGSEPSHTYRMNGQIYGFSFWTGSAADKTYVAVNINFHNSTGSANLVASKMFVSTNESDSQNYSY